MEDVQKMITHAIPSDTHLLREIHAVQGFQDVDELVHRLGDALRQEAGETADAAANQQQRRRHDEAREDHDFPDLRLRRGEDLSPGNAAKAEGGQEKGWEGVNSQRAPCAKRYIEVLGEMLAIHGHSRAPG